MMMWDYGWGGLSWVGMALMMVFWLLAIVGFILILIWLARGGGGGHSGYATGTQNACDIAKQRYARGEIGEEEFHRICRNVGG